MENSILKETLKKIAKNYGEDVISVGVDVTKRTTFSLGSPGLDFCTYNSTPEGCFIEVSGAEHSGKTLLSYNIAADFIRKEKEKPEEERRHILFVDAEHTLDPEWAYIATGYNTNDPEINTLHLTPLGQSAEQIFDMVREFAKSGQIGLIIFDSLTAISPQQTNEASFEKKDMGTMPKLLADFVRRCTGLFAKYRTTFIGIMGNIMNISGYGNPETTPGGTYWRRACSLRLKTKKGAYFDDEGNELKSTAENPAGHIMDVALLKSKFCRGDRRLGRCHLHYRKGIDILWDTIDVATMLGLIDNSTQGSFKLIDPETGEILTDDEGNELKIRGKKNLKPYFEEHPELYNKLYKAVYKEISEKEDPNVIAFEKMLNINVQQEFNITQEDLEE